MGPASQVSPCLSDAITPVDASAHEIYQQFLDPGAVRCKSDAMAQAARQILPECYSTHPSVPGQGQAWCRGSGRLLRTFGHQSAGADSRSLHFMNQPFSPGDPAPTKHDPAPTEHSLNRAVVRCDQGEHAAKQRIVENWHADFGSFADRFTNRMV